jgi:hybrid cluster-associated redox disulfide protein
MDRYTRAFVFASLVYLAAGGILGATMRLAPETYAYLRFAHIHVLLGGFMAMMVFGVGYFILPRFASRTLRWPSLVAVHFWLANASLLAMVVAEPGESLSTASVWPLLGGAGAILQAVSFLLFTINLGMTLMMSAPAKAAVREATAAGQAATPPSSEASLPVLGAPAPAAAPLGPQTPVAEVVDRKEGARDMLVAAGLRPIQDPAHFEMIRARGVTLGHACSRHGISVDELLTRLRALPDRQVEGAVGEIGPDQIIGDVVNRYPAARDVLLRRFGEGCFSCPGFATETLAQGALMHGVEVEELIADLRRTIGRSSG